MAENVNGELFKVAKKGGYDKDDVEKQFEALMASAAKEKEEFSAQTAEKESEITALQETIRSQNEELETLRKNIKEKYQSYIDNYDTIGEVILDSRVQAKKIIEEAYAERDRILSGAAEEVNRAVEEARQQTIASALQEKAEIEKQTAAKRKEYEAVCGVIASLIDHMDAAQAQYNGSVQTLHQIAAGYGIAAEAGDEGDALDTADTQEFDFQGYSVEE